MDITKRFTGCYEFLRRIFALPKKCSRDDKSNPFNKYEYYTYKIQSIVIWEHPVHTVTCLLVVQLLFWMFVNLCWKFYGILFTLMLIFCTHDVWTEKIWPEIRVHKPEVSLYQENWASNPRILSTNELNEYFENITLHLKMTLIKMKDLRSTYPVLFCSLLSFCFGTLTIIGCTISGIWLLYVLVMTAFLSPGVYIHVLPGSYKHALREYLDTLSKILSGGLIDNDDEDEYIPKMSKESIETLNEAYASVFQVNTTCNDLPSLTDDEMLVSGLTAMPSYNDSSIDGTGIPSSFEDSIKAQLDLSDSSSVSSDVSGSMKFQGAHFNNADDEFDTSEDDNENAFLPDASASSLSHKDRAQPSETLLSNIVSKLVLPDINQIGRNILTNIMSSTSTNSQQKQSSQLKHCSTDEEFEIINESDIN